MFLLPIIVTVIYLIITLPLFLMGKVFAIPLISNSTIILVINIIYLISIIGVFIGTIYYPIITSIIVTIISVGIYSLYQGWYNF